MPDLPPTSSPAKRTRRPKASERLAQIRREALRCFAANGFRGTTTREIAAAVGITEAALYRYFPSKQSLYDAIVEEKIATPRLQDLVTDAVARRDDRAVFKTLAEGVLERGLGDPDFMRLFFFTALEGHEQSDSFFKARVGGLRNFIVDYIRVRMEEGAFRARDPVLCARAFLGMVLDYLNVRAILAQDDAYPQPVEEVVDTFVDIFLAGMHNRAAIESENQE